MALAQALELPRFVALKSNYNNKYLRYTREGEGWHKFLRFSGEEVVSPYTKFEVEPAKAGEELVHLRCCYNNKYWVREAQDKNWILAAADEAEEDQTKWSCTLFKPEYVDGNKKTIRLVHVQLGHHTCLWRLPPPDNDYLIAESAEDDKDSCDVFTVINWESLVILPKHVAFKGDNGSYLSAHWSGGHPYLQFEGTDHSDPRVGHEIFTTPDGNVRIRSNYSGQFWRRSPNWIWADSDDTSATNPDTVFQPIKVGDKVIALRNLGNNNFCKRLTTDGMEDCLNAAVSTITTEARLEVTELIISREIYNVNFHLANARIYSQTVEAMDQQVATNPSKDSADTMELKFSYTETRSSSWENTVSAKVGVETTFKTGVPYIVDGGVKVSAELGEVYKWGETKVWSTTTEHTYKVQVPPRSRITVSMLATRGKCDVPFSYTVSDLLRDGETKIYTMDDGVYTGVNSYKLTFEKSGPEEMQAVHLN